MNRTFRYRLRPTAKQSDALRSMLNDHCDLYNAALQERRNAYSHPSKISIRYGDQSAQLKYIRQSTPDQKRWSFTSQQQTLKRLDRTFQAFFRRVKSGKTPGYPRFRSRYRFDTVTFVNGDGGTFLPETSRVRIQGVGHIKINLHRPARGTVKQFSVTRSGKHWHLNLICVDVPKQVRPLTGTMVGIDRGVTHLLADSDGKLHKNPRYKKQSEVSLAKAQQESARKKRGSNNQRRAIEKVAKIHRYIRNQRSDNLHKVSRELVDTYDLIVLEDLKVRNMIRSASGTIEEPGTNVAQKSGLNKAILDSGWGVIHNLIGYKAEEAGIEVMTVNPRNTSRTCYECSFVAAGNRNEEAFECLRCGHVDHADINAAKNILWLGLSHRTAVAA